MKPAKARKAPTLARLMPPAEVDAFMAADVAVIVPAVLRERTDVAIALALTRDAAVHLSGLVYANYNVTGQLEQWAIVRGNLREALRIADEQSALQSANEPIRFPRAAP